MREQLTDEAILEGCQLFGWPGLRPVQKEVIEGLRTGRDVLAVLPTSAGKSATYQLPAVITGGLVVVISPLVALMKDQVDALRKRNVEAYALHSLLTAGEKRACLDAIEKGTCTLLYCSPERLQGFSKESFPHGIRLWAIDECHCISEWGHDFRPAYRRVGKLVRRLSDAPVLALTATATPEVQKEIVSILGMEAPVIIRRTPDRPNLDYAVVGHQVNLQRMVERAGLPCLVYGTTRREVEQGALELESAGYSAAPYHAGLSKQDRSSTQQRFIDGELDVVVATCAFGMGIDHSEIRSVCHMSMPTSLEAFAQESGRSGRDGRRSLSLVRATVETLDIASALSGLSWPDPDSAIIFWRRLSPLFLQQRSWHGPKTLQMTGVRLAEATGFDPIEVGALLRALEHGGSIELWPARERPVEVYLHPKKKGRLRGAVQRAVYERLSQVANSDGVVKGAAAWIQDGLGFSRNHQKRFGDLDVARTENSEPCQVIRQLHEGEMPLVDLDRMVRLRKRALDRVEFARGYLYTQGCRRDYLLQYFESYATQDPIGVCCDRCYRAPPKSVVEHFDPEISLLNRIDAPAREAVQKAAEVETRVIRMLLDWLVAQLEKGSVRSGINFRAADESLAFALQSRTSTPKLRELSLVLLWRAREVLPKNALQAMNWSPE